MNTEKLIPLVKGIIKNLPGIELLLRRKSRGTCSARYCYSVWMRHLVYAFNNSITSLPDFVVELGPGDSIGTGIAAIISGVKEYFALDVIKHWKKDQNIDIFTELVELFSKKTDIPDSSEFPNIRPLLSDYKFPREIFSDNYLKLLLSKDRLNSIRKALKNIDLSDKYEISGGDKDNRIIIKYYIPWNDLTIIGPETVDMIFSQAVLEHVEDLDFTYRCMKKWLKPKGIMSHTIDFKSHGSAKKWNGHWTYSDLEWKIIKGRKKFLINRIPYSRHLELLKKYNFNIICIIKTKAESSIQTKQISKKFRYLSEEDLTTSECFIQAFKN